MNFRDFLSLFKNDDSPWGDLAQDALKDSRWDSLNTPESLNYLVVSTAAYPVFNQVWAAYKLYKQQFK